MAAPGRDRRFAIFITCFSAIAATSFCFVLRALVVDSWGAEFALSATQKGELLGAGLWPFAITIVLMSLFIDRIGFKAGLIAAVLLHVGGLSLLLTGNDYWALYAGTFVMALGNGAVEAVANPLIATLYPEDRSRWLNRLHAAWPAGMIAGGLLAIAMGAGTGWRVKVALMFLPVAVYAFLLVRQRFPVSERVAAGVPYRAMIAEAGWLSALVAILLIMLEIGRIFSLSTVVMLTVMAGLGLGYALWARSAGRPLYLLMVLLMIPLAITELSTDSWISSLLAPELHKIGFQAGWVLVFTAAIVFAIRLGAGRIIAVLTPFGTLAMASAITSIGLFLLAGSEGGALVGAATLYGIGKSFFWGTSLAIVSDRFPKGGAVAINLVAGVGMLAAGILGSVLLGAVQDRATATAVIAHDRREGTELFARYSVERPASIFGQYRALDEGAVAQAPAADRSLIAGMIQSGKKAALRDIALIPLLMLIAYLALLMGFQRRGGYKPVPLVAEEAA